MSAFKFNPFTDKLDLTGTGGGGTGITTIDGDVGSVTGATVGLSGVATGLTFTANSGTLDLGGTLGVANGGTGAVSLTGVLLGHGTSAVTAVTNGNDGVFISSNTGVPSWLANGTTGQVLTATTGAPASWQNNPITSGIMTIDGDSGSITGSTVTIDGGTTGLTTTGSGATMNLGGTLVVANGGTGATTLTGVLTGHGTSAFTASAVTQHDVLVGGASNAIVSVSPSTAGLVLTSNGVSADPSFQAVSASGAVTTLNGDTGSAMPVSGIITISGGTTGLTTSASGSTMDLTGTLGVPNGGTGRTTLTNHGVLVGAGATAITQLGTGSAGQVLQSGGSLADPSYSTATYPSTTTVNQLLYSSASNTVAGLTTANNGTLITSAGGVPSWLANGSTGQVLTATTGSPPSWQNAGSFGIQTINGTTGSVTGSTVSLTCPFNSIAFNGSGTSMTMAPVDGNGNLVIANLVNYPANFGSVQFCTLIGQQSGANLNAANFGNTGVGYNSLNLLQSGGGSTAIGYFSLSRALGDGNTALGSNSGGNYLSTESYNVLIANPGTTGDNNTIRIGVQGSGGNQQNRCFIAGITGVTTSNSNMVTLDTTTGQLGAAAIPAGGITTIAGNSGTATGATVTIETPTSNGDGTAVFTAGTATSTLTFTGANDNLGIGSNSLASITSGTGNSAYGRGAGAALTSGSFSTFLGVATGGNQTTSSSNIHIGWNVQGTIGEANTLRLGVGTGTGNGQLSTSIIHGIHGATVTGSAVLISSSGQLGDISSSIRFKQDVKELDSSKIHNLKPVSFRYKKDPSQIQYGLIAEEVEKVMPELIAYDDEGKIYSVQYHKMDALFLSEIQKLRKEVDSLKAQIKKA